MEKELVFKGKLRRGGAEIEAKGKATLNAELPEAKVADKGKAVVVDQTGKYGLALVIPALPEDAASKTYVLNAVNGVLTWVAVPL